MENLSGSNLGFGFGSEVLSLNTKEVPIIELEYTPSKLMATADAFGNT